MGFNTVAFILNDFSHMLEKSPKSTAFRLSHPPMGEDDRERQRYDTSLPKHFDEPALHTQVLEVFPTFHADQQKFFYAGGNQMQELKPIRLGTTKDGKKTITLELPDYFDNRWLGVSTPRAWPKKGK